MTAHLTNATTTSLSLGLSKTAEIDSKRSAFSKNTKPAGVVAIYINKFRPELFPSLVSVLPRLIIQLH